MPLGSTCGNNEKPGQFNPDPEAQAKVIQAESDAHLAAPGSSTSVKIRWARILGVSIPVGLSIGLKGSKSFDASPHAPKREPGAEEKVWDSEKGRFL
jgi:hypothetical protein